MINTEPQTDRTRHRRGRRCTHRCARDGPRGQRSYAGRIPHTTRRRRSGPYPSDAELIDYLGGQRQLGQPLPVIVDTVERLRSEGLLTVGPVELTEAGRATLQHAAAGVIPLTREISADWPLEISPWRTVSSPSSSSVPGR